MDINEIDLPMRYRHPWEISRTRCLLWELRPYLTAAEQSGVFIDLGAGDQYFDDSLMDLYPTFHLIAADIGYTPKTLEKIKGRVRHSDRIRTVLSISEIDGEKAEFSLMMDSLEYMENDVACLSELASHVKSGGFILLTLPAFRFLFSKHDILVRGSRRYSKKEIQRIIDLLPMLEIERIHYFYTSLFIVRLIQKIFGVGVNRMQKVISGWNYSERNLLTKLTVGALSLDFRINALLGRAKLDLPGLSLFVVCRKKESEYTRVV